MKKSKIVSLILLALVAVIALSSVLVACDGKTKVTVTFKDGDSGSVISTQTIKKGATAIRPQNPQKAGSTFVGWFEEGADTEFDFSTQINNDITLYAHWSGAAAVVELRTPQDVVNFSNRLNNIDTLNDNYYKSTVKLMNDIDMAGQAYKPAGQEIVLNEGQADEKTINGFMGHFDGQGHSIKNLTIQGSVPAGILYIGFFGMTDTALIENVKFENAKIDLNGGADIQTIGASVGVAVGYASRTNFQNVRVQGEIIASFYPTNRVDIGGLAGNWAVYNYGQSLIGYTENCYANITVKTGKIDSGLVSTNGVLDNATVGGLFGMVYNTSSTVAIINCATDGEAKVGKYVGGIAGYLASDMVSIINVRSGMTIQPSAMDATLQVSYVGGFVGIAIGDTFVLDSVFEGSVIGRTATSSQYKSYAGPIVGSYTEDSYEDFYYVAGFAADNVFYKTTAIGADNNSNSIGKKLSNEAIDKAYVTTTLHWDDQCWAVENGKLVPTDKLISDIRQSNTITLISKEQEYDTLERNYDANATGYALLGTPDSPPYDWEADDNLLFFNWSMAEGVAERFYVPIVKDMTLTAVWGDVSNIVGVYTGTATLHDAISAGALELKPDGTLMWYTGTTLTGTYTTDGTNMMCNVYAYGYDEFAATVKDGHLTFILDAGMSGTVEYSFDKTELEIYGEYYADNGDAITFKEAGRLSVQFNNLSLDDYEANYTKEGQVITINSTGESGDRLGGFYSAMSIVVNTDETITVSFTGRGSVTSLNGVVFKKIKQRDYKGKPFVDKAYYGTYINFSGSDEVPYQESNKLVLSADGIASYSTIYNSLNNPTEGVPEKGYYTIADDGTLKISIGGIVSYAVYDEQNDCFMGTLNRGSSDTLKRPWLATTEQVQLQYSIDRSRDDCVFVVGNKNYVYKDGKYMPNLTVDGDLSENESVVTIDSKRYRVVIRTPYGTSSGNQYRSQELRSVGAETGVYTLNGREIELDGIGGAKLGDDNVLYNKFDTKVVVFGMEEIIVFDYTEAQTANNVITLIEGDGYQGIWYGAGAYEDDDGNDVPMDNYYILYVDGIGHALLMYWRSWTGDYSGMWGNDTIGTYTITPAGISMRMNEYNSGEALFYYNKQLAYIRSLGYSIREKCFYAPGYDGPLEIPTLPTGKDIRYKGNNTAGRQVALDLNADFTGYYDGYPFIGAYDGEATIKFGIKGVNYSFNFNTYKLTAGQDPEITLNPTQEAKSTFPTSLIGTWSGLWTGYGLNSNGETRTVEFLADGTAKFNGGAAVTITYDIFTNKIYGSNSAYELNLVYDINSDALTGTYVTNSEDSNYTYTIKTTLKKG